MEQTNNRGGRRTGAGRKRQPVEHRKIAVNVRLSREAADFLQKLSSSSGESKAAIIERLVLEYEPHNELDTDFETNDDN